LFPVVGLDEIRKLSDLELDVWLGVVNKTAMSVVYDADEGHDQASVQGDGVNP
jgi:hypothetical protein